jgi:hypothetical protein
MSSRKRFAVTLAAVLLGAGIPAVAPLCAAAWASQLVFMREGTANDVIEIAHRSRGRPLYVPIAPNYLAYDYPYYYRRGFYPKHIGHGYVYYGHPYSYYRALARSRCFDRQRRCLGARHAARGRWEACGCR